MATMEGSYFSLCDKSGGKTLKGSHLHSQENFPNAGLMHYLHKRQLSVIGQPNALSSRYLSLQLPGLLKEREYKLGNINKIFASHWVSDRQVVFGTKCNKLIVLDLITKQMAQIPSLKSSPEIKPADCPCGIHGIAVNPSRTLLATGGDNVNDLAVYKLPTFDPYCICEGGHTDWIFDIKWLDDEFVTTGSRDGRMSLWCVKDEDVEEVNPASPKGVPLANYRRQKPMVTKVCRKAEKVRAMAYNAQTQEIAALSLNAYLHLWDAETFNQKVSKKLVNHRENVCMSVSQTRQLYAVGSQSHVALIDPRCLKRCSHVLSKQRGCGIRSLNFQDDLLTIGTGAGHIYFYDLRASRYLEHGCGHNLSLNVGKGWLSHDATYRDFFMDQDYPNALYTHCFNESGTKLFAAGGPLPAGLWGNYSGLWQ